MGILSNIELRFFTVVQAVCLGLVVLFLLARDLLMPTIDTLHVSWIFYLLTLILLVLGLFLQRYISLSRMRNYLVRVASLYGFLSIAILPMLFVR
ncbi:MAG: hypothetical protein KAS93_03675 [Gammaproteobacteria bacterium]|nr:hypothetical protein [Gammaproteobacteria bacterium]